MKLSLTNALLAQKGCGFCVNEMEIIRHPQIEGISVFFDTVEYRTPHLHPEIELLWLLEGRLEISCGLSGFRAEPGDLLLFNSESPHEFRGIGGNGTFLCLQVSPQRFSGCFPAMELILFQEQFPAKYFSPEELAAFRRDLAALTRAYIERPPYYEVYCQGQAGLLLYHLLANVPTRRMTAAEAVDLRKRNARLQRFIRFVDERYQEKILLSDFARQENRSVSYMSHFLKNTLNQSFQEYVNSVRFHAACRLICQGRRKMLDVCMESGFSDYRYFISVFRRNTGKTPAEYSQTVPMVLPVPSVSPQNQRSLEKFYSPEESLRLLCRLEQIC